MSPSRHILALVILYSMGCQRRKKTTTPERPRIHQYQRKEQDARGGTGNVYQPEVMKTILIHYHFVICHPSRSLESCPLQMTMTCLPPAIDNLTRSNAFIPSNTCNVKCFTLRSFFFLVYLEQVDFRVMLVLSISTIQEQRRFFFSSEGDS